MTIAQQYRQEGKAEGKAEGIAEGLQEGRQEGQFIGKIQLCQQILGRPISSTVELEKLSLSALETLFEQLQAEVSKQLRL